MFGAWSAQWALSDQANWVMFWIGTLSSLELLTIVAFDMGDGFIGGGGLINTKLVFHSSSRPKYPL